MAVNPTMLVPTCGDFLGNTITGRLAKLRPAGQTHIRWILRDYYRDPYRQGDRRCGGTPQHRRSDANHRRDRGRRRRVTTHDLHALPDPGPVAHRRDGRRAQRSTGRGGAVRSRARRRRGRPGRRPHPDAAEVLATIATPGTPHDPLDRRPAPERRPGADRPTPQPTPDRMAGHSLRTTARHPERAVLPAPHLRVDHGGRLGGADSPARRPRTRPPSRTGHHDLGRPRPREAAIREHDHQQ